MRNYFGAAGLTGELGDADGDVDVADLNAVRNHCGAAALRASLESTPRATAMPAPSPSPMPNAATSDYLVHLLAEQADGDAMKLRGSRPSRARR